MLKIFSPHICMDIHSRSSRPDMFCKKGVLRNFAKFTGKHLCLSFFFNKVSGDTGVFLWILQNFYRTPLVVASDTLLTLLEKWKKNIHKEVFVGGLLMHISRAFETLNHEVLIAWTLALERSYLKVFHNYHFLVHCCST